MNILALMLGPQTGWAVIRSGQIASGTKAFKPSHYRSAGLRHVRLKAWLTELGAIHAVYIHDGEVGAMKDTLDKWCGQRHIPLQPVPSAKVSRYWTGNEAFSRESAMEKAQKAGFTPQSGNEAGALALLAFATMANR